jgi:hypothetical protein
VDLRLGRRWWRREGSLSHRKELRLSKTMRSNSVTAATTAGGEVAVVVAAAIKAERR